jgi:hypothetical protein
MVPRVASIAALLAFCGACSSSRAVEMDVVMASGNCQQPHEGVTRVTLPDVARLRGTQLLGAESSGVGDMGTTPFLIAVATGEKPTAGYGLVYDSARLDGRMLIVTVRETAPPSDAMTAQVITHPCLVLEVPDGQLDTVSVVDAAGTVLGEVSR